MIRVKKLLIISALVISNLPLLVYADISIKNNTGAYGTAKLDFSPCSSAAGDRGIIKPHGTLNVPKSGIQTVCSDFTCEASVYMTNNCSGKKVAKVKVNASSGIVSITNLDRGRFNITGHGSSAVINPG